MFLALNITHIDIHYLKKFLTFSLKLLSRQNTRHGFSKEFRYINVAIAADKSVSVSRLTLQALDNTFKENKAQTKEIATQETQSDC